MPDLSFVGEGYATSNSANTLTVTQHASTTTGDLVVILGTRNAGAGIDLIVDNNGATPFTSVWAGWENTNGFSLSILRRVIQGGDPSTFTFDMSGDTGATRMSLVALTFRDQHADLFDVAPSDSTDTIEANDSGDIACASVTSTIANGIHIVCAGREGGSGYYNTHPSGYTLVRLGWNLHASNCVAYKILASTGASGVTTFSDTGSGSGISQSFIIKNNAGSGTHSYPFAGKLAGKLGGKGV